MHPPLHPDHKLSDWPDCTIEVRCPCSERVAVFPVRLLINQRGDRTISAVVQSFRCTKCKGKPAPIYLVAGQTRTFNYDPPPDWALELVPPPTNR